tara:strand:- start:456 stop:881 length:426 start_codon:yes stop_codon:yes gene_type:complete
MSSSFERSEIFKAPPEKILSLINNFELYKEFLPGCLESSRISNSKETYVTGRLVFSILNKTYVFESKNETTGHEVSINQSKGPFLDFFAQWKIEIIDENYTRVIFKTKFTLPLVFRVIATKSMIDKIGSKFISAFKNQLIK